MSDLSVVAVALATVIVVLAVCATARPKASRGLANVLYAFAAVVAAVWPWSRRP
jgi:hypothetical protein